RVLFRSPPRGAGRARQKPRRRVVILQIGRGQRGERPSGLVDRGALSNDWCLFMVPLPVSTLSYLAYFVNITCSAAIPLPTLSHTPPASDPLPPPHLPCGPAPVLTGGDEASAVARTPPAAVLSAMRGSERG